MSMSLEGIIISPRFKLIISLALILLITSTGKSNFVSLLLYSILSVLICLLFKPTPVLLLKRIFVIFLFPLSISIFIPFTSKGIEIFNIDFWFLHIAVTDNGLAIFLITTVKSFLSILILASLIVSTSDMELLNGLKEIYFPKIMISLIFFMYRYLFLIRDQSRIGQLAIQSRTFRKSYKNVNKRLTFLAGSLFIKSFDRAENIYKSMESRGFEGSLYFVGTKTKIAASNIIIMSVILAAATAIKILEILKIIH
ncbi:MAG: cobalt ECF transporter T component CbiQ [Actinobacteria bacterium]|nr:cobalt ECF transporter T component CbiQ [Actinomycetota bacterium]